jgi:copper(I)-binding protein
MPTGPMSIADWRTTSLTGCSVLLAAFLLLITGCSPGTPVIAIEEQEAILSPVIIGSGSVYMKIVNSGSGGDFLVKVRISIPDSIIELHDFQDGKMTTVNRIPIPAKTTVQLRPASYHIMIFKMPKEVQEGSETIATLSFEKHAEIKVPLQFTTNAVHQNRKRYR